MKKKIMIACLIASMAMSSLAGCGEYDEVEVVSTDDEEMTKDSGKEESEKKEDNNETDATTEEQDSDSQGTNDENKVSEETLAKCMTAYKQVLDNWITAIESNFEECEEGTYGLQEIAIGCGSPDEIMSKVGYFLYDINKDGIPELMMSDAHEEDYVTSEVIAMYTFDGKESANLLFEGWARNRYAISNDGTICNTGSSGAAYSVFAFYTLESNKSELTLKDFYFTEPLDDESIGIFHNTTGSYERSESEDVTDEETFDELWSLCEDKSRYFEAASFKEYKENGVISDKEQKIAVVKHAADSLDETETDLFKANDNFATKLVVLSSEDVKNLKIMKLSLKDVSEDGKITYDTEELYTQDELKISRPLLLGVTFMGDLPEYGISYEDNHGNTFQYAIYESGRDGSIVMEEF